jgi:hypothetical protein
MMLDEGVLREAAFELLASSTSRRYIREAKRLARDARLDHAVQNDPAKRAAAETRVDALLRQLQHETERSPAEFEAAVLLCALARAAGSIDALRRATTSSSGWIRGLASWLQAHGPSSAEEMSTFRTQLGPILTGSVSVEQPVAARDQGDRRAFPRAA